ncbi:MAG TPA: hypothetical protein VK324_16435, partial [Tepidisphaeraceae bacterium]|nr:hypothetical protein [Tepidisphaeraceae bacterium]
MPAPVDLKRADYLRHTGAIGGEAELPRALLPIATSDNTIDLAALRDPGAPRDAAARARPDGDPVDLWIDCHVPPRTKPGRYDGRIELRVGDASVSTLPLSLTVYDFDLPPERHLEMVGRVSWDGLVRLFPQAFDGVTPNLIHRGDARYAAAVRALDDLVALGQRHRVNVVVPRLQPTVKWPVGQPPQIDWREFETIVTPWLSGEAFADKVPLGFWPLPGPDQIDRYEPASQREYWAQAAARFDGNLWLDRSAVVMPLPASTGAQPTTARLTDAWDAAANVAAAYPRLRVVLPTAELPPGRAIDSQFLPLAPALVSAERPEPNAAAAPRVLRTDVAGPVLHLAAGVRESDVRL